MWNKLKSTEKPIVLYGMGNGADRVLDELALRGINAAGVFASDGFVRGHSFRGFPVTNYAAAKERFGDMVVLVCFGSSLPDVMQRIREIDAEQELDRIVETDTLLFYRSSHLSRDLYDEITAYRFSYVDFARRGADYTSRGVVLDGIELRPSNHSLLRRLGLTERGYAGLTHGFSHAGAMDGVDEFTTTDGVPLDAVNIGTFFSGKGYLGGVRASVSALMRKGWSATLYASARGGDDLYVKGVYNNSVDAGLRLAKSFQSGASLALVALSTIGERGLRSASTAEAFTLKGDKLYNPSWGYQAGACATHAQGVMLCHLWRLCTLFRSVLQRVCSYRWVVIMATADTHRSAGTML